MFAKHCIFFLSNTYLSVGRKIYLMSLIFDSTKTYIISSVFNLYWLHRHTLFYAELPIKMLLPWFYFRFYWPPRLVSSTMPVTTMWFRICCLFASIMQRDDSYSANRICWLSSILHSTNLICTLCCEFVQFSVWLFFFYSFSCDAAALNVSLVQKIENTTLWTDCEHYKHYKGNNNNTNSSNTSNLACMLRRDRFCSFISFRCVMRAHIF